MVAMVLPISRPLGWPAKVNLFTLGKISFRDQKYKQTTNFVLIVFIIKTDSLKKLKKY